jgi:hypothetical protein
VRAHLAGEWGQMAIFRKSNAIFSICITLFVLLASFLAPILPHYKSYASVERFEENEKVPSKLPVSPTGTGEPDATTFYQEKHWVPEPATLFLIGLGIIGLAIAASKGKIKR